MFLHLIRLFVVIILYLVYLIILILIPQRYNGTWRKYMNYIWMRSMNIQSLKCNNIEKFNEILKSDRKVIIVSNHTCLFDGFIMVALLGNLSFIADIRGISSMPFMKQMLENYTNSIVISKNISTVKKIKIKVEQRLPYDDIIVMFPDGMNKIPIGKNIAEFKTGAFVNDFDILPIIIKYKNYEIDPTYKWYDGEKIYESVFNRFKDYKCSVELDILDIVEKKNKTTEEFKTHVYNIMNDALSND